MSMGTASILIWATNANMRLETPPSPMTPPVSDPAEPPMAQSRGRWGVSGWSLKTKLALAFGGLMFFASVVFTTWTHRSVEADLRAGAVESQRSLIRAMAIEVESNLELRRDALATVATELARDAVTTSGATEEFFLPHPLMRKLFDAVWVTDATGRLLYDSARRGNNSLDQSADGREFFSRVLKSDVPLMSRVLISPTTSAPFIYLAAPLRIAGRPATGALVGVLPLATDRHLAPLLRARVGDRGSFVLVENEPEPRFVTHFRPELIGTLAPDGLAHPIMARVVLEKEGSIEGANLSGVDTLRSFKKLASVPWVLVAGYPTANAFLQLRSRQRQVLLIGIGLFLVSSAIAWLMASRLLRPLERLRATMESHANEAGIQTPISNFGSAEFAALATAYNSQSARRFEFEERLKQSEQRMQAVMDNVPAEIAHFDCEQRYTFVNEHISRDLACDPKSLLGLTLREARGNDIHTALAPYVARALQGERVTFEGPDRDAAGVPRTQSTIAPDVNSLGEIQGFHLFGFDITALKQAQSRQERVERQLRAISDNLPVLISYVDSDERYVFLNATFETWLGICPETAVGRRMFDVIGPVVYAARKPSVDRCLLNAERVTFQWEAQTLVGRKILEIVYMPDVAPDGTVAGFYTLSSDVTDIKDAERRLALQVRCDTLTGLANRLRFNEMLPIALTHSQRTGLGLAVVFLDLDHFKRINDNMGHAAGDLVLREFALRLQRCVRRTDTVARLAGDEFVIVLEGLRDEHEAHRAAEKVLKAMSHPFLVAGQTLAVSTSVGVAFHAAGQVEASELLARADAALYRSKAAGRNTFSVATV